MNSEAKKELDRMMELANIGAGHAAGAFAQLVGRTIWVEAPVVVESSFDVDRSSARDTGGEFTSKSPADEGNGRDEWCTGVFFEFEGCLDAYIGILFPGPASEELVRRIVGINSGELAASMVESALMEVGNILASHVASAIADTLDSRLLPSIPSLAMHDAEMELNRWLAERLGPRGLRIESGLHDKSGELRGRLILAPAGDIDSSSRPASPGDATV